MNHRNNVRRLILALLGVGFIAGSAQASAPPGRYTVQSATVVDNQTALTWQQNVSITGGADGTGRVSWAGALTYCSNLNLNGTGWRLPTIKELATIIDFTTVYPSIDTVAFPNTPYDPIDQQTYPFWSSTQVVGLNGSYVSDFGYGYIATPSGVANLSFVRCVR